MKFYDVARKTSVEVPEDKIEIQKTKNNRHLAVFRVEQRKLVRFVSKADAERLMKKEKPMKKKKDKKEMSKDE